MIANGARAIRTLEDYYADPCVRHRIREYCGATAAASASCVYFAALHAAEAPHPTWEKARRFPVDACPMLFTGGADLARSMWDRSNLLVHLDIDYQNIDEPGEPFHHPIEVFHKLEPVYRATTQVLRGFGLPLLAVMTGRGYHFTGQVPLDSEVTDRIAGLAVETPRWVETLTRRRPSWTTSAIDPRHARAYAGVGMLMEFLAHRILKRARRRSPIPIVLNGTVVGNGRTGRECASLDMSYAGDPLDTR